MPPKAKDVANRPSLLLLPSKHSLRMTKEMETRTSPSVPNQKPMRMN